MVSVVDLALKGLDVVAKMGNGGALVISETTTLGTFLTILTDLVMEVKTLLCPLVTPEKCFRWL